MKKSVAFVLSLTLSLAFLSSCSILDIIFSSEKEETPDAPYEGGAQDGEDNEDDKNDDVVSDNENTLTVKWNTGYIGSLKNDTFKNSINVCATDYSYTDIITLEKKGTKLTFTTPFAPADGDEIYDLSFWVEESGEWVLDTYAPNVDCGSKLVREVVNGKSVYTYVTSYDGESIRLCCRTGKIQEKPGIYIYETEEDGTLAEAFEISRWLFESREASYYSILEGMKINFIGDSLFAGHTLGKDKVWPALLAGKYSMPYENYGISGCTLSACDGGQNPIINRYNSMPDNDAQIVVFEGGRNDFNKGAVIGALGSGDTTTYKGALEKLILGLKQKYPNAILVGVTFWLANGKLNSADVDCNAYNTAMLEVCSEMGVDCINASDEEASGIRMTDKIFREQYSLLSSDVCHLNYEGMKLALGFFERELAAIVEAHKN